MGLEEKQCVGGKRSLGWEGEVGKREVLKQNIVKGL